MRRHRSGAGAQQLSRPRGMGGHVVVSQPRRRRGVIHERAEPRTQTSSASTLLAGTGQLRAPATSTSTPDLTTGTDDSPEATSTTVVAIQQFAVVNENYLRFLEQCDELILQWSMYYLGQRSSASPSTDFSAYISNILRGGILNSDDSIMDFIGAAIRLCLDHRYNGMEDGGFWMRQKVYETVDSVSKFVTSVIRGLKNEDRSKKLMDKFFAVVCEVVTRDHEIMKEKFDQLPYHRLLVIVFLEMCEPKTTESAADITLTVTFMKQFCTTLHCLRPKVVPLFAYAWLQIVGHRRFIEKVLIESRERWDMYCSLLVDMLEFVEPFLTNGHFNLTPPIETLYLGLMRLFTLIFHDIPDFLSDFSYQLVAALPPSCKQLKNLILSAFPGSLTVPSPYQPNLEVESLPECAVAPRIWYNVGNQIHAGVKFILDLYLKDRSPVSLLEQIWISVLMPAKDSDSRPRYNTRVLSALVMYCGSKHVAFLRASEERVCMSNITPSSYMDVFESFAMALDFEGKYLFLSALTDHLRYPSSHTLYYKLVITHLFAKSTNDVKEIIVRVLAERLVVYAPHPWGLMVTAFELMKNPAYKFWDYEFVRCRPQVSELLQKIFSSLKAGEAAFVKRSQMIIPISSTLPLVPTSLSENDPTPRSYVLADYLYDHTMEELSGLD